MTQSFANRGTKALIAALSICAMAACQPTTVTAPDAQAPVEITRSANAGPGSRALSSNEAAAIFINLCLSQKPGFAGTQQAAAQNGFVLNTQFGTYYHPRFNLSVKLVNGRCSMVFAPRTSLADTEAAIRAAAPGAQFNASTGTARLSRLTT